MKRTMLVCGFVAAIVSLIYFREPFDRLLQGVSEIELNPWAYIGLNIANVLIFFFPGFIPLSLYGGLHFGAFRGSLYMWTGEVVGAVLWYLFIRYLGIPFVSAIYEWVTGKKIAVTKQATAVTAIVVLCVARVMPFSSVPFLVIFAVTSGMKFRTFALFYGMASFPIITVYVTAGALLWEWFEIGAGVFGGLFLLTVFRKKLHAFLKPLLDFLPNSDKT